MNRQIAHQVRIRGTGERAVVIGHGIGATPAHWDVVAAALAKHATVVTFHLAGSPGADPALFSPSRHNSILGFADDVTLLVNQLDLRGAAYLGHSMSAMAGALAQAADPGLFSRMVMVNGSARYVDDGDYLGGFSTEQVEGLLREVTADYDLWAAGFGAFVVGNPDQPQAASEFIESLRALGPQVAGVVFRAAFLSDFRQYMSQMSCPTLVLQSSQDPAVPLTAAQWLADAIPGANLQILESTGHHPHLVNPQEVIDCVAPFLFAES